MATREEDLLPVADLCKAYGIQKPLKIVRGGASRTESVLAGGAGMSGGRGVYRRPRRRPDPWRSPELIDG